MSKTTTGSPELTAHDFPDRASRQLYEQFTRNLFLEFDDLVQHGPLTPRTMSEHIATLYVLSYDELIDLPEVKLYCPYWDPHAAEQNVSGPVREIREIRALHPNRPILVFSCIRFFSFLHRRLVALQDQGMQVVLVCLLRDVSNATDVSEMRDACSYVYCADGQILDYLQVIRAAEAGYVHVFANASSSKIPLLAASAAGQGYVAENNDLLTTMYDLKELSCLVGEKEASAEWLCERQLLRDSSGLLFKNDEEAIMKKLVQLSDELGVDLTNFNLLRNHGTYSQEEYSNRTVFEPAHPLYAEFMRELRNPIFETSMVRVGGLDSYFAQARATKPARQSLPGQQALWSLE